MSHTDTFHSTEVPPNHCKRHADAPHWRTYAALRVVAAILAVGAVLFGGTAIAYADSVSFFTKWMGHGRSMQLSQDGTGTLTFAAGAFDVDQWAVTWTQNPSDSVTITLASLTSRSGAGAGDNVGDQYIATIQPNSAGQTLLYMHHLGGPVHVIPFCPETEQFAPGTSPCGA